MKKIATLFALSCMSLMANAQHGTHCGSHEMDLQWKYKSPEYAQARQQIESFTQSYIANADQAKGTRGTVYHIPVVVHVIHNGEAIGSGANISVAQIKSQIDVLNKDYRKKNTDSLLTSHAFYGATADCEIDFCLATKDPNGNYTTGIDRFDYNKAGYDYNDIDGIIKPNTVWDHTRYLNMWVCTFGGSASSLLGYAMPPGSPADVDGVVISTTSFGNVGNVAAPYNKGRTATHEVGHFFNLEHVWGDVFCGDDLVADTPPAEDANYGCPNFPFNANSTCGAGPSGEMYMNYMDYTDDACMKMFTTGQKNRMRAVLSTGGARYSLTTSNACQWPLAVSEALQQTKLTIFPNPSTSHFYIQSGVDFAADTKFHLYNAIGQDITSQCTFSKEAPNRYYLSTTALTPGTYFVQVVSKESSLVKSITVIQ